MSDMRSLPAFTIVELIVVTITSMIISAAVIAVLLSWYQQYAAGAVRNTLTTDTQATLNRVADEVRVAGGILGASLIEDAAAPSSNSNGWTASSAILILGMPAKGATGEWLCSTLPSPAVDCFDTVVFYVHDKILYRRMLPSARAGNIAGVLPPCISSWPSGGCPSQDMRIQSGVESMQIVYRAVDGTVLDSTNPSLLVRASSVEMILEMQERVAGRAVAIRDAMTSSVRHVTIPTAESTLANFGIVRVGPGGVKIEHSPMTAYDVSIQGSLTVNSFGSMGTSASPANLKVANRGCGSGVNYGSILCGTKAIAVATYPFPLGTVYGDVCATNQTDATNIAPGANGTDFVKGLISGCVAPEVRLPVFDKAAHTSSMTQTRAGSSLGGCNHIISPDRVLEAKTTYTGDIGINGPSCKLTIKGDVYITGNLGVSYSSICVDPSLTKRPTIVVNGQVSLFGVTGCAGAAKSNSPIFISFKSSDSTCSSSATCNVVPAGTIQSTITTQMASSTFSPAIWVSATTVPYATYYAYFGGMSITATGAGTLAGAIISQVLEVGNGGVQVQR